MRIKNCEKAHKQIASKNVPKCGRGGKEGTRQKMTSPITCNYTAVLAERVKQKDT